MIFQYQQWASPLVQSAVSPAPPLSWAPSFPDLVPHVEPLVRAPSLAEPIGPPVVPALSWAPCFPDFGPHRFPIVWTLPFLAEPVGAYSTLPLRVSQLPTETAFQYASVLTRVSQLPVETIFQYTLALRRTRVSQLAVEIIYPFGCFVFVPPLPNPCPAPNPEQETGASCTAPVLGGGA